MKSVIKTLMIAASLFVTGLWLYGADVELVTNPGFESGTTGWLARNCTFNQISGMSHSGTFCGQATGRSATWQGIKQSLLGKVTNGATYTVSGWVRIGNTSDTVNMTVEQADGNGTTYLGIASRTGTNTGWTQLSGTFTVSVSGTLTTFDIYFEGPASGTDLYVDDVSFFGPGISTSASGKITPATRYQTLDGFGAAGGWYEGNLTSNPQNSTLYDLLFKQLGLDIYRFRNTYQIDSGYTDRSATIIKAAKAADPNLKMMCASWSPPAALKSNSNTREGTLAKNASGQYMYAEFAQWWADSLTDLANRGITPDYVSIQNEPDYTNSGWDTCVWTPTETTTNAGFNLGFQAVYNKISSSYKLIPTDGANFQNAGPFIDAFTAADKARIYAYSHHLYAGLSNIKAFADTYNDKPRFMTEYSNYITSGQSTFDDAMNLALTMDTCLVIEGVSAYVYWELFWTGSSGLISVESSSYTIRPVYYAFKQFSAYMDQGWQRVDATSDSLNLNMEAYISPDNTKLTIIVINASTNAMTLSLADLGGFAPSSNAVYRTSASENCASVGGFSQSSMNFPARSITTIALTGTLGNPGTPGPTAVPTAVPTTAPTVAPTAVPGLKGDANQDGVVSIVDSLVIAQYYVGLNPSPFNASAADVNCSGVADIVDALVVAQYYVGVITSFPC
jgi:glucuronoarabinoxylan endo-1,4-beta-xylanase